MTLRVQSIMSTMILLWFTGFSLPALAQPNPSPIQDNFGGFNFNDNKDGDIVVMAEFKIEKGTRRGRVTVYGDITPGWKAYSLNQKGGPGPSKITLVPNDVVKLTGEFEARVEPERVEHHEIFQMPVEQHEGTASWHAPIEISGTDSVEDVTFELRYDGQVCSDELGTCIQVSNRIMKAKFVGYLEAAKTGDYRADQSSVTLRGHIEPQVAKPGDTVKLVVTAVMQDPWHIYAFEKEDPQKVSKPTLIALTKRNGWSAEVPVPSLDPLEKETGLENDPINRYHDKEVSWTIELKVPATAEAKEYDLAGVIGFQACTDETCEIPAAAEFSATLKVDDTGSEGQIPLAFTAFSSYNNVNKLAKSMKWGVGSSVASSGSSLENHHLLSVLGLALVAGLILNVMPCVLPVIGLKIMSFAQQAGQQRFQIFALNLWFTLGLMSIFMVLATLAVFLNMGWGEQFQSLTFTMVLIGIVFTFGLSFLGVWEIPIPGFVGSGSASKMAEKEGPLGSLFKGMLTTILATPCTGPLLIPVLTWTTGKPPWLTYSVFGAIGLGMASPYLIIGAFPSLVNLLPKPGAWMNTFKQFMGFVLMGTVVWLFGSIGKENITPVLIMLVGLGMTCWWIGRTPITAELPQKATSWVVALGYAGAAAAIAFVVLPFFSKHELDWQPFARASLDDHRKNGQTILVDFTADW